jgi:hypothetical protein
MVLESDTERSLCIGEDRNDVLGAHHMPGQKKWVVEMDPIKKRLSFNRYSTLISHPNIDKAGSLISIAQT